MGADMEGAPCIRPHSLTLALTVSGTKQAKATLALPRGSALTFNSRVCTTREASIGRYRRWQLNPRNALFFGRRLVIDSVGRRCIVGAAQRDAAS